ncbi:MAG: ral nucleoside transport system permease protein [Thermoleophilaceae bacterium]|nr:ral nucleoside transport system permease protein [Thermoleophilaceae bacterium]
MAKTLTAPARRRTLRPPRVRVERRARTGPVGLYRAYGIAVGAGVALLLLPLITSTAFSTVWSSLWSGLSSSFGIQSVIIAAVPLVIGGLAVAVPYRLGLWNVGVDGQMLLGAWLAAAIAFSLPDMNNVLLIPLMIVGSLIGGAIWILGPALARAYLGVSEIITTFLLNFAAGAWLVYWATGPWKAEASVGGTVSRDLPEQANLGAILFGDVVLHGGIWIALVAPFVVWAGFRFLRAGFEAELVGRNERASAYAGISVKRRLVGAMLVGGALGGLAGAVEMLGDTGVYTNGITDNTGFAALVVAVLAGGRELAVIALAQLYAVLQVGGDELALQGVSNDIVLMVVGFTLLTGALGDAAARFRLVRS